MFTLNLPGGTLLLHDSAYKLPESRRSDFSYYSLIHSAVGSTLDDVNRHFDLLLILLQVNSGHRHNDAVNAVRDSFAHLLSLQTSKPLSRACLACSVNGQPCDDLTKEGLLQTLVALNEGSESTFFTATQQLPETRRIEYSYYSVSEGIGPTIADVDQYIRPLVDLIDSGDIDSQVIAINNLRYLLFGLLHRQIAPNLLTLSCLVETINGEKWDDYSPTGVEELAKELSKLGISQVETEGINSLYEKILKPLQREFPAHFSDSKKEAGERLQRAMLLECDEILTPDDETLEVRRKGVEREFIESIKPPLIQGKGNQADAIREAYRKNKFLLLTEGLPVDDNTPSYTFWAYIADLQDKYRRQSGK